MYVIAMLLATMGLGPTAFLPQGPEEWPLSDGLGSIALSPFFSIGSPEDGSTFPAPSLKLLTLRSATLPGYKVGQIEIKGRGGVNVSAGTCGLSNLARAHGNYLPSCIPLRQGGEGKFLITDGNEVVNTAGTMLDIKLCRPLYGHCSRNANGPP